MNNRSIKVLHVSQRIRLKPSLWIQGTHLERRVLKVTITWSTGNIWDTHLRLCQPMDACYYETNWSDSKPTRLQVQRSLHYLLLSFRVFGNL